MKTVKDSPIPKYVMKSTHSCLKVYALFSFYCQPRLYTFCIIMSRQLLWNTVWSRAHESLRVFVFFSICCVAYSSLMRQPSNCLRFYCVIFIFFCFNFRVCFIFYFLVIWINILIHTDFRRYCLIINLEPINIFIFCNIVQCLNTFVLK